MGWWGDERGGVEISSWSPIQTNMDIYGGKKQIFAVFAKLETF